MNTRKDNNGAALKTWKKLGPGHIAKPLRHIEKRMNRKNADGSIVFSSTYLHAYHASRRGDGDTVQRIARSIR